MSNLPAVIDGYEGLVRSDDMRAYPEFTKFCLGMLSRNVVVRFETRYHKGEAFSIIVLDGHGQNISTSMEPKDFLDSIRFLPRLNILRSYFKNYLAT